MHEYKILFPLYSATGELREDIHTEIEDALISSFEGYYSVMGESAWNHNDSFETDSVVEYIFLAADTQREVQKIYTIIRKFGAELEQSTIYLKKPSGEVEFVTI